MYHEEHEGHDEIFGCAFVVFVPVRDFVMNKPPPGRKPSSRGTAPTVDERETIRALLQHYATRGAFRSFSEVPGSGRALEFHFLWFRDVKFRVTYTAATRTLTFVDALPAIAPRSDMDRQLRAFVKSRAKTSLPEHRRVDLNKVGVAIVNRKGAVSVIFTLRARHLEYGARKAVHVMHEVLMDFLNDSQYVDYNIEHFNLNPEMA